MNQKHRALTLFVGLILFGGAIIYANMGWESSAMGPAVRGEFQTGRVIQVLEDNSFVNEAFPDVIQGHILILVEVLGGRYEGHLLELEYPINLMTLPEVGEGDRLSIQVFSTDGAEVRGSIWNPERREVLLGAVAVFFVILAIIGGKQGVRAILSLAFTLTSIIFLLVPLMLQGYPVLLTTLIILTGVTVVSLVVLSGWTPKTLTAILGCLIGVASAAMLAHFVGELAHVSGVHMEDIDGILLNTTLSKQQASGLFISGILIASLGAVMDTAVSIASAMEEVRSAQPKISVARLFKSGMNVGRDTMGTMSNTLILAFTGTSLNMIMIVYTMDIPFNRLINENFIAIELIRGIAGSLGIILTVPAVSLIGAKLMGTMYHAKS